MWFRWHNVIAHELRSQHTDWTSERIFNEARKWVIATHQKIVIYDWLPRWLGTGLDQYRSYNPALDPQIDQFFQSAAMRFGHTLVTPGVWLRDYVRNGCGLIDYNGFKTVRTCNFFWRPQVSHH
ncbi:hypothetical protein B566_EDAN008233 [Ephemera danica]|nr:hypothetical protein B566_EDAN008233 [Ephemera danica]